MDNTIVWNSLIPLKQNKQIYEPSQQQIKQYGQYLGFKFPEDQKYAYLFRQALQAQLPQDWQACQAKQNSDIIYRNKKTKKMQYQHPLDNFYKEKIHKLKALSETLNFSQIDQQRQSWLRQSSLIKSSAQDLIRSGKQQKQSGLINGISEQSSIYEKQQENSSVATSQIIQGKSISLISDKGLKTKRSYRKKNVKTKNMHKNIIKKQNIRQNKQQQPNIQEQIRQKMLKIHIPIVSRSQILNADYRHLKTEQQLVIAHKLTQKLQKLQSNRIFLQELLKKKQLIKNRIKIRQSLPIS